MDSISDIPTLSDRIVRLQQTPSLTMTRRRDLVSGIIRMSEVTGVDPRSTPASLQFMRPRIKAVLPAKYNLTFKSWANLRSNFRAALVQPVPRERKCADPEWGALRGALPDRRMRVGLARFIGFCEDTAIAPKESATRCLVGFAPTSKPTPWSRIRMLATASPAGSGTRL